MKRARDWTLDELDGLAHRFGGRVAYLQNYKANQSGSMLPLTLDEEGLLVMWGALDTIRLEKEAAAKAEAARVAMVNPPDGDGVWRESS